jgi:hypothetical protein
MGFRFRRSVKLMPGVRLNVGTGRSSLSLGGLGATVNLSSRGARTTLGLPGTGLSWTSSTRSSSGRNRSTGGGRGPTQRQLEAQARRENQFRLQAAAEVQVAAAQSERQDLLDCWRDMPPVPGADDYAHACVERPFEGQALPVPVEAEERHRTVSAIEASVRTQRRWKGIGRWVFAVLMFPCVFGGVGGSLQNAIGNWSILFALLAYGGFVALCTVPWKRGTRALIAKRVETEWPERWNELQSSYQAYQEESTAWPERERERVEWTRRLVSGEQEVLEETVSSSLEDLDFPFETQCRVAVPDAENAFVLVDLPEIEDVIPEVRQQALKNGSVKEVRRTKAERNADYLHLIAGIALLLARAAIGAGPTLRRVHVAAYTQRRQRGTGLLADEYVYEAVFERSEVSAWVPATVDPVRVLKESPTNRLDLRDNGELKRIDPPGWGAELSAQP